MSLWFLCNFRTNSLWLPGNGSAQQDGWRPGQTAQHRKFQVMSTVGWSISHNPRKPPHKHTAEDIWPVKLASESPALSTFFNVCVASLQLKPWPQEMNYKSVVDFFSWLPMYFHLGISEPDHYSLGLVRWENFKWNDHFNRSFMVDLWWLGTLYISIWTSVLMRRHHKTGIPSSSGGPKGRSPICLRANYQAARKWVEFGLLCYMQLTLMQGGVTMSQCSHGASKSSEFATICSTSCFVAARSPAAAWGIGHART